MRRKTGSPSPRRARTCRGRKPGGQKPCWRVAPTSSYVKDMTPKTRAAPGKNAFPGAACHIGCGQLTLTADQAAATVLYSVEPEPYRADAAFRVAVRAAL
ncbi:hypothetical protein GCM10010129_44550 [Streptomyces fumigatiscleroticus]|nr:hypothetical protein GCM10010129_44550 [Streptomyces fumigatiscleroticus]